MGKYEEDRKWADKYLPQIRKIIKSVAGIVVTIKESTDIEDQKQSTDYHIITIEGTSIGCRLRRGIGFFYEYGDITFRESRPSGVPTELQKMKLGNPKWYLYGWVDTNDKLDHWVFVDMDKVRKSDLLDKPDSRKRNFDGTTFIGIKISRLSKNKCLRRCSKRVDCFLKDLDQMSLIQRYPNRYCGGVPA